MEKALSITATMLLSGEGKQTKKTKRTKALAFVTATMLAIVILILFGLWWILIVQGTFACNLSTGIFVIFLGIVFCGSTLWGSVKAYREWRRDE